jgi:hypothetical protein
MIPLSAVSGTLNLSKTSHRNYELKLNGEVVGTLNRPSLWSQRFVADSQDGRWSFRRSGFCGSEIVDTESGQQIAFCKWTWGGKGQLTFADGQTYQIGHEGFWRPVWTVSKESREIVLQLHTREKRAELPDNTTMPDGRIALLILFTWYCVLKAEDDAAAAVMVAAVS